MSLDTTTFEGKPVQYPDGNPKTRYGLAKVPMHLFPASARIMGALAFKDGARKYGPYNWRESGVTASVYVAALQRHLDAWFDGENVAQDSGVHPLGHVIACAAIIIDAAQCGQLNDDRPPTGNASMMHQLFMESFPAPATKGDPENV